MSAPRSTGSTPQTCRFHAKGRCKHGAKCRNLHLDASVEQAGKGASNESVGTSPTQSPKSDLDEDAPSSSASQHPPRSNSNNRRGSRSAKPQNPCFAWIRKGSCYKGAQCPHSHDTNTVAARRLIEINEQQRQFNEEQRKRDEEVRRQEAERAMRERVEQEAAERARQAAAERARQEAVERARQAAAERVRQEEAERARQEAAERARQEAAEHARQAERRRREEAERKKREQAERRRVEQERRKQQQERRKREEEERARQREEEQRRREEAERLRREAQQRRKREQEEREAREEEEQRRIMAAQAKEILQRVVSGSIVTFGPGLDIQNTITGFESCRVVVKGLPRDVQSSEVADLFAQQGLEQSQFHLVNVRMTPDGKQEATVVTNNDVAQALAVGLEDLEFRDERLSFELGVFNGTGGMGLRERNANVLVISCRAPSLRYVVEYPSMEMAQTKVRQLNGHIVAGRKIKVAMNQIPPGRILPSFRPNSIVINNLPDFAQDALITEFAGSYNVRRLKPFTYNVDYAIVMLQRHVDEHKEGETRIEVTSRGDNETGVLSVRVVCSSWESAKQIHDSLADRTFPFISNGKFWLKLDDPKFYTIYIPPGQHRAQQSMWKELEEGIKDRKACSLLIHARNQQDTRIQVSGSNTEAVGALKVRVEGIAAGIQIQGWHISLVHPNPELLESITRVGAFLRTDFRKQALKLYGPPRAIERATVIVERELERQHSLEYTIQLKPFSLRYFVHTGLPAMKEIFGDDCISLDIGTRTLTVKGGEEVKQHLNNHIGQSTKSRPPAQGDHTCPICYDTATSPMPFICGHIYCTACIRHLLVNASDTKTFPLACIGDDATCGEPIPIPVIRRFLPQGPFDRLLEVAFHTFLDKHPEEYKHCKTPDCNQIYRATKSSRPSTLHCPSCFSNLCSSCGETPHDGMSCTDARIRNDPGEQERLSQRWLREQAGVKQCPRCSRFLEKTEGCNHMSCPCGAHLCWRCLGAFPDAQSTYDHMNSAHGGLYGEEPRNVEVLPAQDPFHGVDYHEQAEILRRAAEEAERARNQRFAPQPAAPRPRANLEAHRYEVERMLREHAERTRLQALRAADEAARARRIREEQTRALANPYYQYQRAAATPPPPPRQENGWCSIM
ncbi:hypothetical protein BDZ89DRAFT_975209 [Hymenopellis radicata]|nr:hypothetical protein BDZ89DRAFT_975209 [Hymenopellis radicata]